MSCSSSTTIKPKFLKGRNREDLAPIINFESPVNISCQISFLLPLDKFECHITGLIPKRDSILLKRSAVKEISGNNINDCFFLLRDFSTASKYTSVFPEPVTPSIKKQLYLLSLIDLLILSLDFF